MGTLPFDLSVAVTARGLQAVLAFIVLIWLVATIILLYHWWRYGAKSVYIIFAALVYLAVSFGLLGWLFKIALTF